MGIDLNPPKVDEIDLPIDDERHIFRFGDCYFCFFYSAGLNFSLRPGSSSMMLIGFMFNLIVNLIQDIDMCAVIGCR